MHEIHPQNVEKHVTIIEQRTTAHFPDPPQCILIAHLEDDSEHKTAIYTFNPLNGEGLDTPVSVHPFKVLQVAELPIEGICFSNRNDKCFVLLALYIGARQKRYIF